jgi:glutamyl/glutaminyl-tRNA synthetase
MDIYILVQKKKKLINYKILYDIYFYRLLCLFFVFVLGHAKAMNFNFGLARKFHGQCIMRFDDTNPEAEKVDYIENILENVHWLGHQPVRVTYSSDYFQNLYDLAIKLIKKGKAYVDHQTGAQIKESRETRIPSPWRERPVEENLRLFEDMRKGKYAEGEATLRMKGDMNAANPQVTNNIMRGNFYFNMSSHFHYVMYLFVYLCRCGI